jgi:hypothetical protein
MFVAATIVAMMVTKMKLWTFWKRDTLELKGGIMVRNFSTVKNAGNDLDALMNRKYIGKCCSKLHRFDLIY